MDTFVKSICTNTSSDRICSSDSLHTVHMSVSPNTSVERGTLDANITRNSDELRAKTKHNLNYVLSCPFGCNIL